MPPSLDRMETSPKAPTSVGLCDIDRRYRAPLISYFIRRLSSRNDAEDLAQEVLFKIVRYYRDDGAAEVEEALVFKIAGNLLRDRAKRDRTRSANLHFSVDDQEDRTDRALIEDREPERVLLSREAVEAAVATLKRLSPKARHAFLLYRLEGLKHREIAESMGMSVSAVEKYVMAAMKALISEAR
jgi:RNA polymerase sigma-70 factor (ECF subfamily)